MPEEIIVGIDLGTTFSAIAYVDEKLGKPEIITNAEGERTTPSVIFFEENGQPIVGREALNQVIINPERAVRFVKREMGESSFEFNLDGKEETPESLSAIILKKLKNDAQERLGKEIKKAVISVPAYFKDAQREATRQAGEIAGLEVVRIINEPTAAALAYGLEKEEDQTILVYDFGGGTFDVTIMEIAGKEFTVKATDGDAKLGGSDIDQILVDYLANEFKNDHGIDLREQPQTCQDLWDKAERAKKALSIKTSTAETLSLGEKTAKITIDLDDFNDLIQDIIAKSENCMNKVIQDAGMSWSQIDKVLLVGGSSRIPAVKEMIKRVTGKEPVKDTNPDECVASGAAIQGVLLQEEAANSVNNSSTEPNSKGKSTIDIQVIDVASHSLGVRAFSSQDNKYVNSIIIPRMTKIPCEKTKCFATREDNQGEVEYEILQGEDPNPRSPHVDRIGKAKLKNLPPHKAGELLIEVTLRYTADGTIEVVTKEQKNGEISREVVMTKSGTLSTEIVETKRQELEQMVL